MISSIVLQAKYIRKFLKLLAYELVRNNYNVTSMLANQTIIGIFSPPNNELLLVNNSEFFIDEGITLPLTATLNDRLVFIAIINPIKQPTRSPTKPVITASYFDTESSSALPVSSGANSAYNER